MAKRRHFINMSPSPVYVSISDRKAPRAVTHGQKVTIDEDIYQNIFANNAMITDGLLVEIDTKTGQKIIVNNPNIMLDSDIDTLLDGSLEEIEQYCNKVTSLVTMERIYNQALSKDLPFSLCNAQDGFLSTRIRQLRGLPDDLKGSGVEKNLQVQMAQRNRGTIQ